MEKKVSVDELASLVGGEVAGDGATLISGFGSIDSAGVGEITFLVKANKAALLDKIGASAVIVPLEVKECGKTIIRVKNPYLASAIIHNFLLQEPFQAKGVHPTAYVGQDCVIPDEVTISPKAVIGDRVSLGQRVFIGAGAYVGDDVVIGDDTVIRPNVTIEYGTIIGKRVIIHAGSVLGSDGYGYAADERGCHIKRPQVGVVRIDDDVEIGANCCIDRAAFGVTWVKSGTKLDNMVHLAHNVVVGENSLLLTHVGIAGSTTLGRNVIMGGKASAKGHIHLGDGVMVAGKGGVTRNQPSGAVVGGMPAIPIKQWTKAATYFGRIPEMHKDLRKLKKALGAGSDDPVEQDQRGESDD